MSPGLGGVFQLLKKGDFGYSSRVESVVVSSSDAVPYMNFSMTFMVYSVALQWSHWPLTSTGVTDWESVGL